MCVCLSVCVCVYVSVCVCMCVCACMCRNVCKCRFPQQLEEWVPGSLKVVSCPVWVLGTKLGSPGRVVCSPTQDTSPTQTVGFAADVLLLFQHCLYSLIFTFNYVCVHEYRYLLLHM